MLIERTKFGIRVIRTDNDPKVYKESQFWHNLKKCLNDWHGHDLVKKLMYKDGHMVDDHQYYLRDRGWKYGIVDHRHALRLVYEPYNAGEVELALVSLDEENRPTDSRKEK